jgi:predicted permease
VNGVILRPLPYNDPDELVSIGVIWAGRSGTLSTMSQPDLRDVQAQIGSIESTAGFSASELTLTGMGDAEAISGAHVTDGLLEVFQEAPIFGRDISTEENIPDGPRVVLIGHSFWQERMGGTPDVLGQTVQLDGATYEVVGVAPQGFDYPRNSQVWVPYYLNEDDCGRGCHVFSVVGRMTDGSTVEIARSELSALAARLEEQYVETNYEKSLGIMSMEEDVVGDVRTALLVLLGAVGMVLLIACANVANLLLARASVRAGEMAMRSALGAARGRLVQQLLLEALVLATFAGVLGVALASVGVSTLLRLAPTSIPRLDNVGVDSTVLLFAFGTVILITLLFGLVPALRLARTSVATVLNQSGRGKFGSANQDWSRSALLVAEVAFSLMLLFGAGLLLRSFSKLQAVELGFDRDQVFTFRLSLPEIPYDDDGDATVRFFETLEDRIAEIPGVEQVGSAFGSPLGGSIASTSAEFLDRPAVPEGQEESIVTRIATPGYHETLRVPLIRGRAIDRTDRNGVTRAAMVSQSLVDKFYPNKDPIGQQIRMGFGWAWGTEQPWTIVGVVGDMRSLRVTRAPQPEIYLSHGQMGATNMSVLVRLAPNAPDVLPAIRKEVQALDPNVPLRRIEMLEETVDRQFGPARFYMLLLSIFAAVAVALAGIGLYGVIAYLVSQRTREIGIRIALGAKGGDVIRMVLTQGIKPAAIGIGLGVAGAYWSSRVLQSLLYNVEASDIATFAGVTVMLTLVVLLAIVMPARKASHIPPVDALRVE